MDVTKIKINPRVIKAAVTDFVDFKGDTHKITAVAYDSLTGREFWHDGEVRKAVSFGISIQNPQDEYIELIGINRAAKAIEKKLAEDAFVPEITSNYIAGIDDDVLEFYLTRELDYVTNNINIFIKGYNQEKAKYEKKRAKKDAEIIDKV